MGAADNRDPLTQVRAMQSRRVTTPQALMAATKATVCSDYGRNPNGAKLYTAGIRRRRLEPPRSEAHDSFTGLLSEDCRTATPPQPYFVLRFWAAHRQRN
jgi:hypothetical protein